MATIEYSLFRARFIRPAQTILFGEDLTPRELFMRALEERPTIALRQGYKWHVGNMRYFSEDTGYFAVGRTTKSTIEKFDESTGNFIEEELEKSPYTHCVFDAGIGLIGIAKKASLAQTAKGVAARVEQLLRKAKVVDDNEILVEITPIPDPEGFLRALATAYRVTRFTATFRRPNPLDADELFQKPLSVYLSATNGEKGKAEIQGEDLNREVIQAVTRSTAATGNQAAAKIRRHKADKATTINLKGDPVKRSYDEEEHEPEAVLSDLIGLYNRVRND